MTASGNVTPAEPAMVSKVTAPTASAAPRSISITTSSAWLQPTVSVWVQLQPL